LLKLIQVPVWSVKESYLSTVFFNNVGNSKDVTTPSHLMDRIVF